MENLHLRRRKFMFLSHLRAGLPPFLGRRMSAKISRPAWSICRRRMLGQTEWLKQKIGKGVGFVLCRYHRMAIKTCWLVVWNMTFMTFHILGIIIPTDELIFSEGRYTTNQHVDNDLYNWEVDTGEARCDDETSLLNWGAKESRYHYHQFYRKPLADKFGESRWICWHVTPFHKTVAVISK